MIVRFILAIVALIVVALAVLALRYPAHTAITVGFIYDSINPAPSMDFEAIGIEPDRVRVSEESKVYIREALLRKFPAGTDFQHAKKELLDAGVTCTADTYASREDRFEIKLPEADKGPVYRCSGEFGGGRVVACLLFFDVQTNSEAKIVDYWVNLGCTGP